jgi:outer membrane protein assembly factor BamB
MPWAAVSTAAVNQQGTPLKARPFGTSLLTHCESALRGQAGNKSVYSGVAESPMVWLSLLLLSLAPAPALFDQIASAQNLKPPRDWTTWGYDQERTGWNKGETSLTTGNVKDLTLLWKTQLSTPPKSIVLSTLTAPLVAEGVSTSQGLKNLVYLLGADDTVFALDADTGTPVWQRAFPNPAAPLWPATWLCSNTVNDTPVIDKQNGILFLITSDGQLRGLNLSDGADRMAAANMVEPYARAWSLNLIDNVVYTTSGRGCGQLPANQGAKPPVVPGSVSAMDVSDLKHPQLTRFYTSGTKYAGPWGRGGVTKGPNGTILAQTADGLYDPAAGIFGETVLKLAPRATRLLDSFTPANWQFLNTQDLDLGSASSAVFAFGRRTLIAVSGKEGFLYLLDAADLGGGPPNHAAPLYQSSQLANDAAEGKNPGEGVWGAITTFETADGKRFLYVPIWGPPSKNAPKFNASGGAAPNGSIMAFQVVAQDDKVALLPQWTSPNMLVPDPPVVANGVLFAIQTGEQTVQSPSYVHGTQDEINHNPLSAKYRSTPVNNLTLFAFDAETGRQLYSSEKLISDWVHFSEPVVALGKVFIVTHDARVCAFGLKHDH